MKGTVTKSMVPIVVLIIVFMLFVMPAQAEFVAEHADIPEYFNFGENYYTTFGGPDVSATVVGDSEFSCGDSVILNIDLMNKGVVTGFRSETDDDPVSVLDQKLQQAEMSYESQRTTAIGIVAILTSPDPNIEVKSGPQEAGSLATGEQTSSPVQFSIDISKNAPSGIYPLKLNLYYGYQKNVQVDGDNETDMGVTNMDVGLWYDVGSQNITIPIYVEEEADFEVTNVTCELVAGNEGMLYATYSNVGELPAKDATVRISVADPFSTTDDQAYLGSLEPGESAVAVFKLKTDELAVVKAYAINSEIKYEDTDGHSRISDTVKIRTEVLPGASGSDGLPIKGIIVIVAIIAAAAIVFVLYRKMSVGKMSNGKDGE